MLDFCPKKGEEIKFGSNWVSYIKLPIYKKYRGQRDVAKNHGDRMSEIQTVETKDEMA